MDFHSFNDCLVVVAYKNSWWLYMKNGTIEKEYEFDVIKIYKDGKAEGHSDEEILAFIEYLESIGMCNKAHNFDNKEF